MLPMVLIVYLTSGRSSKCCSGHVILLAVRVQTESGHGRSTTLPEPAPVCCLHYHMLLSEPSLQLVRSNVRMARIAACLDGGMA